MLSMCHHAAVLHTVRGMIDGLPVGCATDGRDVTHVRMRMCLMPPQALLGPL